MRQNRERSRRIRNYYSGYQPFFRHAYEKRTKPEPISALAEKLRNPASSKRDYLGLNDERDLAEGRIWNILCE